jgi:tRNA wybutosine-synthesizing protein 3
MPSEASPPLGCVLSVDVRVANGVKEALKAANLLDPTRLSSREDGGQRVALPCVPHSADAACPEAVAAALASGAARWGERAAEARRGTPASPAACLRAAVAGLLSAHNAPAALLDDLPRRWEQLGDVALLPASCLHDARWAQHAGLLDAVWPAVAAALGVRRVARQAAVDPGPRRSSRAVLVWPPGETCGWTKLRENGLWYTLDVTQSMFSSGNGTEKARMAALSARGEVAVDCFAGIGYYTLPLLLLAGAAHVYACEWNPPSLEALRRGLALNGVAPGACTVLEGDCAVTAPRGVAHRVLLGLLPSSECAWPAAAAALVDAGGTAHVHTNVRAGGQAAWAAQAAQELQRLARLLPGRAAWVAAVTHLEVVKSYAPRVLHVVADVRLGPPQAPAMMSSSGHAAAPMAAAPIEPLLVLVSPSAEELAAQAVQPRRPALLRGLDLGPAASLWADPAHFATHADGDAPVSVHVARSPELDWHARSFEYEVMPLSRLAQLVSRHPAEEADAQPRHYYMRAVGRDPRKEAARLAASFPALAAELRLPAACLPPQPAEPHSSVLRLASPGLALWLHYDVLDNVLVQLAGTKRILLFLPTAAGGLYLSGSSSTLPTRALWAAPGSEEAAALHAAHPRYAAARAAATEITLSPGEALFIPALWAHAVRCDDFSAAVNVFWPAGGGSQGARDVYGNVDAPAAADALAAAATAAAALRRLPPDAAAFYAARAIALLQDAAQR